MQEDKALHIQIYTYERLDRLLTLSNEYSLSVDYIVNVAIQRLLDNVDDMRSLRANTYQL